MEISRGLCVVKHQLVLSLLPKVFFFFFGPFVAFNHVNISGTSISCERKLGKRYFYQSFNEGWPVGKNFSSVQNELSCYTQKIIGNLLIFQRRVNSSSSAKIIRAELPKKKGPSWPNYSFVLVTYSDGLARSQTRRRVKMNRGKDRLIGGGQGKRDSAGVGRKEKLSEIYWRWNSRERTASISANFSLWLSHFIEWWWWDINRGY